MRRLSVLLLVLGGLGACRTYDNYTPVAKQDGLIPASQFARYGTEQAQAVAIGRSLAKWYVDETPEGKAKQVSAAVEYAKTLSRVETVVADSVRPRLTVTFKSGWRSGVVAVDDGVEPEDTPGVKATK